MIALAVGVRERNGCLVLVYETPNGTRYERIHDLRAGGRAKSKQPKGIPLCLWWPEGREVGNRAVLLLEGESDLLAALTVIRRGAPLDLDIALAAVPGTGMPSERVRDELTALGATEVVLGFDADDSGRQYTHKVAKALDRAGITVTAIKLPDGMDLSDWLASRTDRGNWLAAACILAEVVT